MRDPTSQQPLPPLRGEEFHLFNHMAGTMQALHGWFRTQWNVLYDVAKSARRPKGMSIKTYLSMCLEFCERLEAHHTIEEVRIFPYLAKRMPSFANKDQLVTQHKAIHAGLERLEHYARGCLNGETDLQWGEVKEVLDSFGTILWTHLDEEVRELGAEQTRKYWSAEEMRRMPM
ncbi:hypothetical protein BDW59DRAFT_157009 [Aspergillus cavernicola]|uniref:Hemerythrin-like domain-containing protein n=1 Tax=Aspergillus cavernicola TaxID=176166 RepID=A0ABR4IYK2_9EURO